MNPIAIIVLFFMVLAAFIGGAVLPDRKVVRVVSAMVAFGWACLMFIAAGWAESLNYNIWYSSAAEKMLNACIMGIEEGRQDAVLIEMRRMSDELDVTYERRGNFRELADRVAENLEVSIAGDGSGDESQPVRSGTDSTSSAAGSHR